jgi:hypothetical protein
MALPLEQGAWLAIRAKKAGWILNPAIDQLLQPSLRVMIEHGGAAQRMQVPVGVETEFGGTMVPVGQLLAGIAKRLEMADGVGVLQSSHE